MKEPKSYRAKIKGKYYIIDSKKVDARSKSVTKPTKVRIPRNRKPSKYLSTDQKRALQTFKSKFPTTKPDYIDDWVEITELKNGYHNLFIKTDLSMINIPFYKAHAWIPIQNSKWVTVGEINGRVDKMGEKLGSDQFDHEFPVRDVKDYMVMIVFTNRNDNVTHILTLVNNSGVIPTMNIQYVSSSNNKDTVDGKITFELEEKDANDISYYILERLSECKRKKAYKTLYLVQYNNSIMVVPSRKITFSY